MKRPQKDIDFLILQALKNETDYISGQELAKRFNLSRQGLWKHISKFINYGYEIVAVPHLGYKFISSPDKLYSWEILPELKTKYIGRKVYHYEVLGSTQDVTWELGLKGEKEGAIVVAERQLRGRGRLGRKWISPTGGIYFSLLLRPNFLTVTEISKITLMASLACLEVLKPLIENKEVLHVKWPNDILVGRKKIAGILSELNAEQDKVNFLVLGVGINVNSRDLPNVATSLFLVTGKRFSRVNILVDLLKRMEELYEEMKKGCFEKIRNEWHKFCNLWGKRVQVNFLNKTIEGTALTIDEQGYLVVRSGQQNVRIFSGDVAKLGP